MAVLKVHKVVTLPVILETDSIYFVRTPVGFDLFITNHLDNGAHALSAQVLKGTFAEMINKETTTVVKGTVVFNDGNGFRKSASDNVNAVKTVGVLVSDVLAGGIGFVQIAGILKFTAAEWLAATGSSGGLLAVDYFLNASGQLSLNAPVEDSFAQWCIQIGQGLNNTDLLISPKPPIEI